MGGLSPCTAASERSWETAGLGEPKDAALDGSGGHSVQRRLSGRQGVQRWTILAAILSSRVSLRGR